MFSVQKWGKTFLCPEHTLLLLGCIFRLQLFGFPSYFPFARSFTFWWGIYSTHRSFPFHHRSFPSGFPGRFSGKAREQQPTYPSPWRLLQALSSAPGRSFRAPRREWFRFGLRGSQDYFGTGFKAGLWEMESTSVIQQKGLPKTTTPI